ncbi:Ff.00g094470.m01.CDS01 [Fusarium sp. VM40]|nr:Ff.00g094470.m01.CDS01 [Fusarium sp. VM40]
MAKKKSKGVSTGEGQNATLDDVSQTNTQPSDTTSTNGGTKKRSKKQKEAKENSSDSSLQTLNICRNKHWRYISAFHGPWLQMPLEILESTVNVNWNTLRPRPIDPAVMFDLLKIRRLVEEATNLTVRAASDIASPLLTNVHGGLPGRDSMSALGLTGPAHGVKLTPERRFRMREHASQKLSRAYHLDEIACSVAAMQGASAVDELGALVLHRKPQDPDAKYVHFFHEKIPSRQLVESTSLQPLTDIISERPQQSEALRTRAIVKTFREDYLGATQDLTLALTICRTHQQPHRPHQEEAESGQALRGKRWRLEAVPAEDDQPRSLGSQLLFLRGVAYLSLACQYIENGISGAVAREPNEHADEGNSNSNIDLEVNGGNPSDRTKNSLLEPTESRKLVKKYAKWALRDLLAFMSHLEYAPYLPTSVIKDFNDRVNLSAQGVRSPRSSEAANSSEPYAIYPVSHLFAAVPPVDLPPYPSQELSEFEGETKPPEIPKTCELLTYHPFLSDALHSLLLCHCLAQTSARELQRHTYMAARVARLADGHPIFQVSRSPARSDWMEILRRADDSWLQLSDSWENLCKPAPLPFYYGHFAPMLSEDSKHHNGVSREVAAAAAASLIDGSSSAGSYVPSSDERRQQLLREHGQRVRDALNDQRVCDEDTFRAAIEVREKLAKKDRAAAVAAANGTSTHSASATNNPGIKRWTIDDTKDYPVCTARATLIAQWVREAPVVTGTTRRKKRTKKVGDKPEALVDSAVKLNLEN